ncbi:SLC13 family permease [Bacteroidia bacterium]|nr:SLC13 family permease [Bacteroidia bacterium]GHT60539.1 SLC13 family permease [Bacteroidia bacterium]
MNGKIRSDIVALCALLALMLFGILTPDEALSGFSNSILIMMIGLFVVGGAIFQTGLANSIGNKILHLAGNSQTKLFILMILGTAVIGGFVSNTGTIAIMLPIVVSMATSAKINTARLLIPLAYAGSMGGMLTLIGTPPNLIIHETLVEAGHKGLSFFSFLPVGIICIVLGVILLIPLSKLLVKKNTGEKNRKQEKSLSDLAAEYSLSQNLFRIKATRGSKAVNKSLQELQISVKYGLHVLEIRRRPTTSNPFFKTIDQKVAQADTHILIDDILYVSGNFQDAQRLANDLSMSLIDVHQTEENSDEQPVFSGVLRFDNIGIAEVILLPNSHLVNMRVSEAGFREKYKVNILGIQRRQKYILHALRDEKFQPGDVLLVQGEWHDIELLSNDSRNSQDWVVVGQPLREAPKTKGYKAPVAAVIMVLMIVSLVLDIIPAVASVLIASVLMILTGCLRNVEDAYKTINWQSIVLIGSMLPMGIALEKTGAVSLIAQGLVNSIGGYSPYFMLGGIYLATSLLTMFISNTATAVLFAPIALHVSATIGVSPIPFLFAVTVAASMCFASPFSTPPNALVMSAGRYTFMDYVKVGLPMQLIYSIVMIFVLPLLFPF